ncbi:hypothetical protein [Clostridium sp.]|uniref:hypothetical protein n=1 Tax=Clostridium sp. TaxID=1506 RepID=UPI002914EA8D|nr:hypothetical protein [Clostridium sp.]MDU5106846.1 hypothetical protein [Clostridium sp.]
MLETEKAYIAGIIDGEGSIMLQRFHSNEFPAPCVSIASTSLELLKWIKKTVEKGMIISKKNYNPEVHKDCYSYVLRRNDAIYLIKEIYPYLIIDSKRKHSELILKNYKALTPRNGRYSLEMLEGKENFYNEFISIK